MSTIPKPYNELHPVDPNFPVRINHNIKQFTFPPHYHNALEMVFITEGHNVVHVNHTTYYLEEGDLLIIGSHHIHAYGSAKELSTSAYYMLLFDWHYLTDLRKKPEVFDDLAPLLLDTHHIKKSANTSQYIEIFQTLYKEYYTKEQGYELMVTSSLYQLLTLISRYASEEVQTQDLDQKQLLKAQEMIQAINTLIYTQYHRDIPLAEAAEVAGYSLYHFTRVFKLQTGFTFKAYLTNFRINMVKESLINDHRPITEIALSHGFNSIKSFNRNFKTITDMSPSDYRKAIND